MPSFDLHWLRFGSTTSRSLRRGQLPNRILKMSAWNQRNLGGLCITRVFGSSWVAFLGPPLLKHFSKIFHGAPPARCWWPGKIPTRFPSRPSMKASPTCHGNKLENDTPKAAKVSQLAHLFPWMLGTVPSFEVNYMSTLSFDRHPAVRRFWFETLSHWMLRCVDKAEKKNLYWWNYRD